MIKVSPLLKVRSFLLNFNVVTNSHNLHFNKIGQVFLLCFVFVFDVGPNAYTILGFLTHFTLEAKINISSLKTIRLLLQAELIMQPL